MRCKLAPKTDKLRTKKAIKNLKRNKRKSDKHRVKYSAPKLTSSPALELAKITLWRASQLRSFSMACPSMVMPSNPVRAPHPKQVSTEGNLDEEGTSNPSNNPTQVSSGSSFSPEAGSGPYFSLKASLDPCIHWEEGKAKQINRNIEEPQ